MDFETARQIALKRDRVCQSCGEEDNLHAHHIIPRREDGPDTPENLVILCQHCHPKYEGTQIVPSYAGGGARIRDVVAKLTLETLNRLTPDFKTPDNVFKSIQRDPKVCANCFRKTTFEETNERKVKLTLSKVIMTLFQEIRGDPDICSNCFRQTHDRIEQNYRLEVYFNEDKGEWDVTPVDVQGVEIELPNGETEVIGGKDDRVYRKPEHTTKIPETGGHRGIRTICQCGFRWGPKRKIEEWKNRPLDKKKFFEIADRLLARVHEAGATIDEDAYYEKLDTMKSNPDEQFADDRIYDAAVSYAISVASLTPKKK